MSWSVRGPSAPLPLAAMPSGFAALAFAGAAAFRAEALGALGAWGAWATLATVAGTALGRVEAAGAASADELVVIHSSRARHARAFMASILLLGHGFGRRFLEDLRQAV